MEIFAGRVIRFRRRLWRVDRVGADDFTATAIHGRHGTQTFLKSIEQGSYEPAEPPPPDPESVSDPQQQSLLLAATAARLSCGIGPLDSLRCSAAVVEPYQLVPMLAAARMDPVRLLIADDVGLGKSIESGLIVSDLLARGRASKALFAVPAALAEQWMHTLERFFGLGAVIVSGRTRPLLEKDLLPGQTPWSAFRIVISAHDYLAARSDEVMAGGFDLVVADEAHRLARPHSAARGLESSKARWEFLRKCSENPSVRHLLLVTATPHQGNRSSFASLVQCLDQECVDENGCLRRQAAAKRVIQRRRSDVEGWCGRSRLPGRRTAAEVVVLSRNAQVMLDGVKAFCRAFLPGIKDACAPWAALHFLRRCLSSPAAIRAAIDRRIEEILGKSAAPAPLSGRGGAEEARAAAMDTETTMDLTDEERWSMLDRAAHTNSPEEVEALLELSAACKKVTPSRDLKIRRLVEVLSGLLAARPGNARAAVFTRYSETRDYLVERLRAESKSGSRLNGVEVFGVGPEMTRSRTIGELDAFESSERAILVATDCISEGTDLQSACAELLHYDLPWSVNLFEQRNGRVDRWGQRESTVGVTVIACADDTDVAALELVVDRAVALRRELGACPLVFESPAELRSLARRLGKAGQLLLPLFEEEETEDQAKPFPKLRVAEAAQDCFFGDCPVTAQEVAESLSRHFGRLMARGSAEQLVRASVGLEGGVIADLPDKTVEIRLGRGPALRAAFDPEVFAAARGAEFISHSHRLARRFADDAVSRAFSTGTGRVAVFRCAEVGEPIAVVHAIARILNEGCATVIEELVNAAFEPRSGRIVSGFCSPAPDCNAPPPSREIMVAAARAALWHPLLEKAAAFAANEAAGAAAMHGASPHGGRLEPVSVAIVALTVILPASGQQEAFE